MRKLTSLYSINALVVIGVVLALGLAGCSLPRSDTSGDAAQFSPPTSIAAPPMAASPGAVSPPAASPELVSPEAVSPGAVSPEAAAVQDGATIRLEPPSRQLNVGDTVTVDIVIENISDLSAADVELQFDPVILEAEDAQPDQDGVQLEPGNFLSPDFVVLNEISNNTGIARYALTQVAVPPVNGTGVLARISFRAEADGISMLSFTRTDLSNSNGQRIPINAQSGQIVVGEQPQQPTPTFTLVPGEPTSTPTQVGQTPGPTLTPTVTPTPSPLPPPPVTPSPVPPPVTPVPPQTHLPPGAIIGTCYRVQAGDTLFSIGKQFGVDPGFIAALNKLWSPHTIYVNQGLFIPDPASGGGHGPTVYIAKTGDTLDSVAQQCNLPTAFLADVNRLPRDAALQQGHVLFIPIPPPVPVPPPPYIRPHPYPPPYCCPPPPPPPCYGPKSYCY